MQSAAARGAVLCVGVVFVFAALVAILLRVMPGPLRQVDYLVIGAIATFTSMLLLFLILVTTWIRTPNTFYKKRTPGPSPRP
jgi:hypothetical protein